MKNPAQILRVYPKGFGRRFAKLVNKNIFHKEKEEMPDARDSPPAPNTPFLTYTYMSLYLNPLKAHSEKHPSSAQVPPPGLDHPSCHPGGC